MSCRQAVFALAALPLAATAVAAQNSNYDALTAMERATADLFC